MIGLAIKRLQKLSWQSLNLLNELASSYGDETILLEDRIMHLIKINPIFRQQNLVSLKT